MVELVDRFDEVHSDTPVAAPARRVADSLAILWPLIADRVEQAAEVPAGSIPEPAGAHMTSPPAFLDERADAVYAQYLDGTYLWLTENPDQTAPDLPAAAAALIGTPRGDQLGITAQTAVAVDYADSTILINPAVATPSALERGGRWYPVITFPGSTSPRQQSNSTARPVIRPRIRPGLSPRPRSTGAGTCRRHLTGTTADVSRPPATGHTDSVPGVAFQSGPRRSHSAAAGPVRAERRDRRPPQTSDQMNLSRGDIT